MNYWKTTAERERDYRDAVEGALYGLDPWTADHAALHQRKVDFKSFGQERAEKPHG